MRGSTWTAVCSATLTWRLCCRSSVKAHSKGAWQGLGKGIERREKARGKGMRIEAFTSVACSATSVTVDRASEFAPKACGSSTRWHGTSSVSSMRTTMAPLALEPPLCLTERHMCEVLTKTEFKNALIKWGFQVTEEEALLIMKAFDSRKVPCSAPAALGSIFLTWH